MRTLERRIAAVCRAVAVRVAEHSAKAKTNEDEVIVKKEGATEGAAKEVGCCLSKFYTLLREPCSVLR